MAGKETITIKVKDPIYYLDEEVTYAQADAWFDHVTRDLRMDVIYPQDSSKLYPCIVWICGGAWIQVNKAAHIPYLANLARKGFVVASVDYRLGHEAPFPGALIDIKAAIRCLRARAKRYSIDTKRFGVSGESAGGYLAAMTALTRDKKFEAGEYLNYSSAVQAACPWYMPCDMAELAKDSLRQLPFFNGDQNDKKYIRYISPLSYVTPKAPPFLIIHGTEDTTIPVHHGEMMYEALVRNKVDARFIALKGEEHAGPQFFQQPLWDIIAEFFTKTLKLRA
jgi:acetyl esterase/lipase